MTVLVESGSKVSRYLLIQLLGTGGMAEVWGAEDETLKRQVAVKIALPGLSEEPDFVKRFIREAQTAARLDHPHIVPVHDVGMHLGRPFLIMPRLTGGRLSDKQPGNVDEVLRWLRELASALDYAHSEGVIHRDVKPGNVLFDKRGRTLLADFGLAKSLEEGSVITQSGAVMGTPVYMAPEQAMGNPTLHPVLPASDQYALGMIAYRFVSGRLPFDVLSTPIVLMKKVSEELPLPSTYNPALSAEVDSVFRAVLSKEPRNRFALCQDFVEALATALAQGVSSRQSVPEPRIVSPAVEPTLDVPPATPGSSGSKLPAPPVKARPVASEAPVPFENAEPASPPERKKPQVPHDSHIPSTPSVGNPLIERPAGPGSRRPPAQTPLLVLTGASFLICIAGVVFLARSLGKPEPAAPAAPPTIAVSTPSEAPGMSSTVAVNTPGHESVSPVPEVDGRTTNLSRESPAAPAVTLREKEKTHSFPDAGDARQVALLQELARRATQGEGASTRPGDERTPIPIVEIKPVVLANPTPLPAPPTPIAVEEPRASEIQPASPENALLVQITGQLSGASLNLTFQFDRPILRPDGNVLKVERIIASDQGVELVSRPWKSMECSAPRGPSLPCWIPFTSLPKSGLDALTPGATLEVMLTLGQRKVLKRVVLKGY